MTLEFRNLAFGYANVNMGQFSKIDNRALEFSG